MECYYCPGQGPRAADTNYKDLAKEIRSIDIFKELTFRETSVTTANFRCTGGGARVLLCIYFL